MTRKKQIAIGIILAVILLVAWRWWAHSAAEADDPGHAVANSNESSAAVARVERHTLSNALTLAGEFKPYQDVDVHAKVAGYIRKIYVDVGDHVKEGQTLAVLEIPELAAQLAGAEAGVRAAEEQIRRAKGDVQRAESTHAAVHSAYT